MEYNRLKENIDTLRIHNERHIPVLQLCDKTEYQLIRDIISDCTELLDKIENGTLIELPCPIGTAIYYLNCNQHDGWWIEAVLFDFRYLNCIGKYAFLTKAEAQAKLKELQND